MTDKVETAASGPAAPSLHVVPDRRATIRHFARMLGIVLAATFSLQVAGNWMHGEPPSLALVGMVLAGIVLAALAGGWLIHEVLRHRDFTLDAQGVTGCDGLGRRRRLGWHEIGAIRAQGPCIELLDRDPRRNHRLSLAVIGIDRAVVHARLVATAGAAHPLTRQFADG